MKEDEVRKAVKEWLESRFVPEEVTEHTAMGSSDLIVSKVDVPAGTATRRIQVECKGTYSNPHRGIGQCLAYYVDLKAIPTYLAVPSDYQRIKVIERILEFFDLPIGLITVYPDGKVQVVKKSKGRETTVSYKT